jgi:hypothetical protein
MGSYFGLKIKKYDVISGKSYLTPEIGILFSESEKVIENDEEDESKSYTYVSTAGKLLERLSIIGITPEKVKREYSTFKKAYLAERTSDGDFYGDPIIKTLSLKKWCETIKEIIENETFYCRWNVRDQGNPIYTYILENDEYLYGFPTNDVRKTLSLILSLFQNDEKVVLDLSALIGGGYYEEATNFVESSKITIVNEKYYNENIIILAEGTYDIYVLRETLKLLFPDKYHYFSFLDFDNSKTPGGAGHLVNYIKALSGASVTDKMIAIFDNDSAAYDAIRVLNLDNIPKNIRYSNYPSIKYLSSYPTIGPTGKKYMNINNRASSIELYFGDDILQKEQELFPVQWTGYMKSILAYQGEIIDKSEVQDAFQKKIQRCVSHNEEISRYDWSGIRAIWNHIYDLCSKFYI